jgi:hypothetical protein
MGDYNGDDNGVNSGRSFEFYKKHSFWKDHNGQVIKSKREGVVGLSFESTFIASDAKLALLKKKRN